MGYSSDFCIMKFILYNRKMYAYRQVNFLDFVKIFATFSQDMIILWGILLTFAL